jgi:hypothetical protein
LKAKKDLVDRKTEERFSEVGEVELANHRLVNLSKAGEVNPV